MERLDFLAAETVHRRRSVRTYQDTPLTGEEKAALGAYMEKVENPFGIPVRFRLLKKKTSGEGEHLGTYGVIKNACDFIAAAVQDQNMGLEALGYSFEKVVLYATSLGLGTCWIGGTFDKTAFAAAMELRDGEMLPCVSPVGHPAKKRAFETIMRQVSGGDRRLGFEKLFFEGDFRHSMERRTAGPWGEVLELVRLAPSALNKQPWRIVRDGAQFHFFKAGAGKAADIHDVDMGIALCHFHLGAMEKGMKGEFLRMRRKEILPGVEAPKGMRYVTSWVEHI